MSKLTTYHFTALDTLFFRESRPMESIGGSELGSVFPPPIRTLAGALCSAIAESKVGWRWSMLENGVNSTSLSSEHATVKCFIKDGVDESLLSFHGVWVTYEGERLYPAPAHMVATHDKESIQHLAYLELDEPQSCDLGDAVRLPCLPQTWIDDEETYKKPRGLDKYWLKHSTFERLLQGQLPKPTDFISNEVLFVQETRLGIARNNAQRTVEESKLFQTSHIRLKDQVGFEVDVEGMPDSLVFDQHCNRTGGEGRIAQIKRVVSPKPIQMVQPQAISQGIILCLMTPYLSKLSNQHPYLPFLNNPETNDDGTWSGKLNGVPLRVHSMACGKVLREGGWNVKRRSPRPVKSYLPAGTVWYCTIESDEHDLAQHLDTLHNTPIGQEINLGRGHIVVGQSPVELTKVGVTSA